MAQTISQLIASFQWQLHGQIFTALLSGSVVSRATKSTQLGNLHTIDNADRDPEGPSCLEGGNQLANSLSHDFS